MLLGMLLWTSHTPKAVPLDLLQGVLCAASMHEHRK
jgi:hypothetical protein